MNMKNAEEIEGKGLWRQLASVGRPPYLQGFQSAPSPGENIDIGG